MMGNSLAVMALARALPSVTSTVSTLNEARPAAIEPWAETILFGDGADVNHVDKKGMTPLLHSASIDFGDSAIIELLIQSGAHIDARNREGLTALDLARKYNHTHLIASLQPLKTTANAASAVRSFLTAPLRLINSTQWVRLDASRLHPLFTSESLSYCGWFLRISSGSRNRRPSIS